MSISPRSWFAPYFLRVQLLCAGWRDLPSWLKDFDKLGLQLLGRRPTPVVNGSSWQIEDAVAPVPGEIIINKISSGVLSPTNFDQTLHNMGITSLTLCGLTTAVCVGLTARQTADRGFRIVMVADACTELSQDMHEAALLSLSHIFGQVRATQEASKAWREQLMRIWISAATIVIFFAGLLAQRLNNEEEVRQAVQSFQAAFNGHDFENADEYTTDDWPEHEGLAPRFQEEISGLRGDAGACLPP